MLKPGIYRHRHEIDYVERSLHVGDIVMQVKETASSFIFRLLENTVRYDAPQIDSLFRDKDRVVIRKRGSGHAMRFIDGDDGYFVIYPYQAGVPYSFQWEASA